MASPFVIIAHRGHQGLAPENTIDAFESALKQGFQHFETDVQLTSDGIAVILHDEILGRTIEGHGRVADHTWNHLKELDAGSWYCCSKTFLGAAASGPDGEGKVVLRPSPDFAHCRVPTLEEMLRAFLGRAHIHLELKSTQPELPAAVAKALQSTGWVTAGSSASTMPDAAASSSSGRAAWAEAPSQAFAAPGLTITSFHLDQLKRSVQELAGLTLTAAAGGSAAQTRPIRHAWLVHSLEGQEQLQTAEAAGITQLCPRADLLTVDATKSALDRGVTLRGWALSSEERLMASVRAGVQGGTLNDPDAAKVMLQAAGIAC